jgi:signal transduction histidine kinase
MASGRLVSVPNNIWGAHWSELCAPADGRAFNASAMLKTPAVVPPQAAATASATKASVDTDAKPGMPATDGSPDPSQVNSATPTSTAFSLPPLPDLKHLHGEPQLGKRPIPDDAALAKSRELLKELYIQPRAARATPDRAAFVKRLLADAVRVDSQSPDRYEMLRVARDEAARLGDVRSAIAACAVLEREYRVESMPMRLKVLEELKKAAKTLQPVDGAFQEASRLTRQAFDADRYDIALAAHEIRIEFGRIIGAKLQPKHGPVNYRKAAPFSGTKDSPQEKLLKAELARLQQESELLTDAQTMQEAEQKALAVLATKPSDPDACETVGRYLCFVKDEWDLGLPFLGRAADIKLRFLASIDLTKNRTPTETLSLGDEYFDLASELKQPQKRGLHLRAARCYTAALRDSKATLETLKTKRRLEQVAMLYGPLEFSRVFPKEANETTQRAFSLTE